MEPSELKSIRTSISDFAKQSEDEATLEVLNLIIETSKSFSQPVDASTKRRIENGLMQVAQGKYADWQSVRQRVFKS